MTEAQPLTAQTQGISSGDVWATRAKARGKGTPSNAPSGNRAMIVITTRPANGSHKVVLNK